MHGLTTCCKVLIIWIHSDCFCKQMLQILFLIKYQGLDSNVGPCQQKIAQILALGPNPTKDGCECLKHCRLPSPVGWLARHRDMMQRVWILGCFSGVRVGMQSRWLLDSRLVWGLGMMLSSQAGQSCSLISSTTITTNSLNLWGRYRSQSQVRSWRKNYELSFHLNNSSFFLTTWWDFFYLVMAVQ